MVSDLPLAYESDIPEGKAIIVQGPESEIALFKLEGKIYALDNSCPHMGGPLGEGEIEDSCVTCPWHAWQFDIKTGVCQNMPGDDARPIAIVIREGSIYLK
jgi:nitrite reductase (NADH) small subunit